MSAHSEHGASICKRWWNCPGSVALVRGLPNPSSEHAIKGTAAHTLGEICLNGGQDAADYVDRSIDVTDSDTGETVRVFVTPDMTEAVQVYLDECRGQMLYTCPDTFANLRAVHPDCVMVEKRFDLAPLDPPAPMFGTSDFAAYVPVWQELFVKDYKNGVMQVDATTPQLKYYALGAIVALGPDKPVKRVHVAIIQPNAHGREAIVRATYEADELAEWSVELMQRAAATLEPDAPLVPGEWCKSTFCPAAGRCTARAAANLAIADAEFADIEIGAAAKLPEIRLLSPEQIGGILAQAPLFEDWLDAVRAAALASLRRGEPIPGWKLAEADTREKWRDPQEAEFALQTEHGFAESEIYEPRALRSSAQMRDAMADRMHAEAKAAGEKLTKKRAKELARGLLKPLVMKPRGSDVLTPATDPRAAVLAGGDEFAALPDFTGAP